MGVRVLIAEDSHDLGPLFARILEKRGAEVEVADSMRGALHALFANREFDVFLCDLALQEGDGITLVRTLRTAEEASGRHLPAAAVTGLNSARAHIEAVDAGFDEYVAKPVSAESLVELVARLFARKRRVCRLLQS
jgi:CheY-like chemotaxis protein